MPGVTEKQILAARQMTAIEFLQRYRPEELVKAGSRGEFQLRTHDSFKINAATVVNIFFMFMTIPFHCNLRHQSDKTRHCSIQHITAKFVLRIETF